MIFVTMMINYISIPPLGLPCRNCDRFPTHKGFYINKIQQDATVYTYLFTAKSLYMFRVSITPIIRST